LSLLFKFYNYFFEKDFFYKIEGNEQKITLNEFMELIFPIISSIA
jgi:hypothetical protein